MTQLNRREMTCLMALGAAGGLSRVMAQDAAPPLTRSRLEGLRFQDTPPAPRAEPARHWESMPGRRVRCTLCPHECVVADQERGTCGVRENQSGKYFTLVHGHVCAAHIDPVEKKPLYHYLPGSQTLSLATPGCNMECQYCQNWQISQFRPEQVPAQQIPPAAAARWGKDQGVPILAYTYSEPVVFYEYMSDTADQGRALGLRNVMISNGYIMPNPLRELLPRLDAVKVDFKGFSESFYRQVCRGRLRPVLDALELIAAASCWLELVILVVPTLNDGLAENRDLFRWVRLNLGPDVPVHLTRFQPMYKLRNLPPTPVATLDRLRREAQEAGIHHVYVGNVWGHPGEHTECPGCGEQLIRRAGMRVVANRLRGNACPRCDRVIAGVFT